MTVDSRQVPEVVASLQFAQWLENKCNDPSPRKVHHYQNRPPSEKEWKVLVSASFATFLLHVKARMASLDGTAFYTIGPCGEEFASCWGALLRDNDTVSLHYRHLATQIARQMVLGNEMDSILLDRARGYVCSTLDPVTGGKHCALGGIENFFYNTSTLASQVPASVGRALASSFDGEKTRDSLHLVTLGDGSAHNAAFLSSKNLAENAYFRNIKCPVLFVITDNDLSISFKGQGYMRKFAETFTIPVFTCKNASDFESLWDISSQAFNHVRLSQKPAVLFVHNVVRRFGHAATDRQDAYRSKEEISQNILDHALLISICESAVQAGAYDFPQLLSLWRNLEESVKSQFQIAMSEPKLSNLEEIKKMNQAPFDTAGQVRKGLTTKGGTFTMRKCMTQCLAEQFQQHKSLIYLGEDVRHGGYYLVTEGLASTFPRRILDFPPCETGLLGVALGFSQRGFVPVVELPYLKYLDCGADQYFEIAMMHWITNGSSKMPGMIIRLQGFDRGKFGGNFHTHNSLYLPPGIDMLCFSNGEDWTRGFREAVRAAQQGRIVVLVDPTEALTRKHLFEEGDGKWLCKYPSSTNLEWKLDDVISYPGRTMDSEIIVLTYGNGVPQALLVQNQLDFSIDVLDCPNLTSVSTVLAEQIKGKRVLFADPCKMGQNPFGNFVQILQDQGRLPRHWLVVGAAFTYNPLSRFETFLNASAISQGVQRLKNMFSL